MSGWIVVCWYRVGVDYMAKTLFNPSTLDWLDWDGAKEEYVLRERPF